MIWTGQPQQGLLFKSSDIFVIPFNLFFCGFALFWEILAVVLIIKKGQPSFLVARWGLPFVLVGIYLVFGSFILDNAQ